MDILLTASRNKNTHIPIVVILKTMLYLLVLVICVEQIQGQWDCVDLIGKQYYGYYNTACTRPRTWCQNCTRWVDLNATLYNTYNYTDSDENYCRWPDPDDSSGPWCYYEDESGNIEKEFCHIEPCSVHAGCLTGNGYTYRDKASYTQSGHRCISWNEVHRFGVNITFPGDELEENFCRNPDNASAPWCYYQYNGLIKRDFCKIDTCTSTALSRFTRHTNSYISNLNNVFIRDPDMTEEMCAEKCLETTSFVCRSFEYRFVRPWDDKKCVLSNESLFTTGMQHSPAHYPTIDLFTRKETICDAYEDKSRMYPDECPLPLGLETGVVLDSQFSASSFYDENHQPANARLNDASGWMANGTENGHWIQVSFRKRMKVTGVLTQGGGDVYGWIEKFMIRYSLNGKNWWNVKLYKSRNGEFGNLQDQNFTANGEPDCLAKTFFDPPIWANHIRLYPLQWFKHIALRLELLGCIDDACNSPLGLVNGNIKDSQILASSTLNTENNGPAAARLKPYGRPGNGWIPAQNDHQWIKVELHEKYTVTAIATQGCEKTYQWVTGYQLNYRASGGWIPYREINGTLKDFQANKDPEHMKVNILIPNIIGHQVKIIPITWTADGVCLKLELIGCPYSVCNRRLGIESGEVTDAQMTASSNYYYLPPSHARLHYETWTGSPSNRFRSCWEPRYQEPNQWLQVDLLELHTITGVVTQGSGDDHDLSWIYRYTVQYLSRYESDDWYYYRTLSGAIKKFQSYADNNTPLQHSLERPFVTQKVRIGPVVWEGYGPCLRLELIGCRLRETGEICGGTRVRFKGQCIGAVSSSHPDACHIFAERSHKLKIDGVEMQIFLQNNFESVEIDSYRYYRIGVESSNGTTSLRWHDDTPLVYENWIEPPIINSNTTCVLVDRFSMLQWTTFDCETGNLIFATLCQFDLNECFGNESLCETCVNVPGSYYCSCPRGYILHEKDGQECEDICHHHTEHTGSGSSLIQLNETCYTTNYMAVNSTTSKHLCSSSMESLIEEKDIQAMTQLNVATAWIDNNSASCTVLQAEPNGSSVSNVSCFEEYPAVCKQEISDVKCQDIFRDEDQFLESRTTSGMFSFFGYPPFYDAGTFCHFRIIVRRGNHIKFTLIWSNLRQDVETLQCIDKLIVTDRHHAMGVIERGIICGVHKDFNAISLTNQIDFKVEIHELTPDMPSSISFVISYKEIEGSTRDDREEECTDIENYTNSSGTVQSPNFPRQLNPFSFCIYKIQVSPGKFIILNFTDFLIPKNAYSGSCINFVSIFECGGSSHLLIRHCGDDPPLLISNCSCIVIFYHTGLNVDSYGFSAVYNEVDIPGCGFSGNSVNHICNAPAAYISTPNYPHGYQNGARCSWLISTPPGTFINLTFVAFDIEGDASCSTDYIKVFDGDSIESKLLHTLCNAHPPTYNILSSFNKAFLVFSSDTEISGDGLLVEYHSHYFAAHTPIWFSSNNNTDVRCPQSWDIFNGNCYRMFDEKRPLTWFEAELACRTNNSFLVSIQSAQEMDYLHAKITTNWTANFSDTEDGIYIGLTDEVAEGRFVWTDGSPLSFTDWSRKYSSEWTNSQPDGFTSENCGLIMIANVHSTNHWHDVPCAREHAHRYICKKSGIPKDHTKTEVPLTFQTVNVMEYAYDYGNFCGENHFLCDNGECILKPSVCDGYAHCIDNSDELYCWNHSNDSQNVLYFDCDTNDENIPISRVCDFVTDCMDGSDESSCVHSICNESQFQCENGQCIPDDARCNLISDCVDESDEISCDICNYSFQCYDGTCQPNEAVCDGYKSCTGQYWEDEQNCDYHKQGFKCSDNELQCNNGACINQRDECIYDLTVDGYQKGCKDATHLRHCESFECPEMTLKCPGSYCIPQLLRCNGKIDCPDESDEYACDSFACPGSYRCQDSFCISQQNVCDGRRHCPNGDDELYCDVDCPDGCDCIGYSVSCVGADWNRDAAAQLPIKARALNLSGIISQSRERRNIVDNKTLSDVRNMSDGVISQSRERRNAVDGKTISDILYTDINKFTMLLNLDLSSIGLEIVIPGTFSNLHNLRILRLANNKIKHLGNGSFLGLHQLTQIDLSGNPIQVVKSGAFLGMQSILSLSLENMFLTDLPENAFMGLNNLTKLSLRNNSLVKIATGAFSNLQQTTYLDISENEGISEFGGNVFEGLDNLETLISDDFLFCCLIGEISRCEPEPDEFSSCDDLMRNQVLRVFMWLLGFGALIGNFFVLVWRCHHKERNQVQGSLILNLAISDFLIGTYMIIIASADMYYRDVYVLHAEEWKRSFICHVSGFISVVSSEISVLTLTTISIDRLICIRFPFSKFHIGPCAVKFIIVFQWLFLITLAGVPFLSEKLAADFYGRSSVCLAIPLTSDRPDGWIYSVFIFVVLNLVCFFVILFCYTSIYFKFKKSEKMVASKTAKPSSAEKKLAIKMAFIISTDFFCWVPIITMSILSLSGTVMIPGEMYAWTAVFVLPLNSSLNPYIYTLSTIKFKKRSTSRPTSCSEMSTRYTVKQMDSDSGMRSITFKPDIQDRFTKMLLREIERYHVVPMISTISKRPFLLSQYMQSSNKVLCEDDINAFEEDLNTALSFVHRNGLVHGSVNEHSILVQAGSPRRAYLILTKEKTQEQGSVDGGSTKIDKEQLAKLLIRLREPTDTV